MQSWIDDLRQHYGPLAGAAERYTTEHGISERPPRGVEALRHLVDQLQADETLLAAAEDHRRFVESAGAFYGLVLADQLTADIAHVEHEGAHGLRLGQHGFLDPFDDIAAALDDADPSAALIAAVARAEAEAQVRSTPARVVAELSRQLALSEMHISGRFGMRVWLQDADAEGDIEVDIEPLVHACDRESQGTVERAVDKVVGTLTGRRAEVLNWEEARTRILPRLVGESFIEQLGAGVADDTLALTPLTGELRVAYILDHGERARFVRRSEVEHWSLSPGALQRTALHNLAGRSSRARLLHVEHARGTLVVGRSGDALDAARLLLPGLYPLLAAELGSHVVVAVPHRDLLLACNGDDADAVADLRGRAAQESRRAPHAISAGIFRLDAGGHVATVTSTV